jgi:hypothetical protein
MELLTPKETAKLFKCSLAMIYKMADRNQLACFKIPCLGDGKEKPRNMIRFKLGDVMEFLENHYKST